MKHFHWITPFLFTLASILFTSDQVSTLTSPGQSLRLLIILWVFLCLLIYPAYLLARDREWASLLLTVFVFGFYLPQSLFLLVGALVLIASVVWLAYFRLRRFKVHLAQFFNLLNGIALFLIGLALYLNMESLAKVPWPTYFKSVEQARNYSLELASVPSPKPDIYYIVLDGYLRSDMLQKLYAYDNSKFTMYLQGKGFVVPGDFHSNYAKTAVSVSSTLNMDYVDSFSPGLMDSQFWWLMEPFIDHSRVRAILESQGYKTVSLSTDWTLTENTTTDIYLHPFPVMLTEYERYFLGITALGYVKPLIKDIASIPTFDTHRRIIRYSFESLMTIPERDGPKFIFAHIPAPHPPFVFDKHGNALDPPGVFNLNDADDFEGSSSDYQQGYIGQVEFVNAQMQRVIDAILVQSKTPPIIIIQADHGSGLFTDFSSAENTCIKERFSPFAAYYLPGIAKDAVPQDLSAVNIYRILFNQYFHADLALLENEHYYYKDTAYIYRLVDVTARVDDECAIR